MLDKSGAVVWDVHYESFGKTKISVEIVENNLRFPGQYFDNESTLCYNSFRWHDSSSGRYLQSDPIGLNGGINTYAYVEGNPLMYTDPTGENPIGMALGFGIELGMQLAMNGGNWSCVDWADVAISTIFGAVAPGVFSTGKTVWTSGKAARNLSKQAARARTANRQNKMNGRVGKHKGTIRDAVITQAVWPGKNKR